MSIETHTDSYLRPGRYLVWYDVFWEFKTLAEAQAFAEDLHARKTVERKAYEFTPPIVHLYVPKV